jgi:hypothetical protein
MNVAEERARRMRELAESWCEDGVIDAGAKRMIDEAFATPWRSHGVFVQAVFFVLTVAGMGAVYGLVRLVGVPEPGFVAGAMFVTAAELLIRKARWFGTGVESALWIGGLLAMITELPNTGSKEALLVIAAAFGGAGFRVRNALFGTVAAVLILVYFEDKWDLGLLASVLLAAGAALALLREWKRPSTEWLWIGLALVSPVAGWFMADAKWYVMTIALYGGYGLFAVVTGLVRRHHAPLLSGLIGLALASVEIGKRVSAPLEARLALGGALLLVFAFIVHRAMRARATGLVVTPSKLLRSDEALSVAGALAASHASRQEAPAAQTARTQGDGGFGGAGASGDY